MQPDDDRTRTYVPLTNGAMVSHYRIIEKIGAGGMGEVYLAEDTQLGRQVALKFLPPHLCQDADCRARFKREAQAAARLNHPNVVTIHGVAEEAGRVFIIMEYVRGRSLKEFQGSKTITPAQVAQIAIQICDGLAAAHGAGIVHRDIKPSNITLDQTGRVRLLDFGLAKGHQDEHLTQTGAALGTANYMSPEQAEGKEVDSRSDLFSLGVVLYELLTGKTPFARANVPAILHAIVHDEPTPLSSFPVEAAEKWQPVIDKALAKNVAARYQSAAELARDLAPFAGGAPADLHFQIPVVEPVPAIKSLAVLYLRNLGKPDDEYLSYGLTEDLIVDMTRIGTLRMAPMRAVLKFKDTDAELDEIARRLDVALLLDGSILKTEETVRVSVQLVDPRQGKNLWAERWEQPLGELPRVKRALAQGINRALGIESLPREPAGAGVSELISPQAYEYYLRAKFAFEHKGNKADVETALGMYRHAVEMDPALLRARTGIAQIHLFRGEFELANRELTDALQAARTRMLKDDEAVLLRLLAVSYTSQSKWDDAWDAGQKALELVREARDLAGEAETLTVLINVLQPRAEFDRALDLFQRVLEIYRQLGDQDKASEALKNIGGIYYYRGDYAKARELFAEALAIARRREDQSLEAKCLNNVGITYINTGGYGEALRSLHDALKIYEQLGEGQTVIATTHNNLAFVYGCHGEYRRAIELNEMGVAIHKQQSNLPGYLISRSNIAHDLMVIGDYERAIRVATEVLAEAKELNLPVAVSSAHNNLGTAYFWTGDREQALRHLHEAIKTADASDLRGNLTSPHSRLAELHYHHGDFKLSRTHNRLCLQLLGEQDRGMIWVRASTVEAALQAAEEGSGDAFQRMRELVAAAHQMKSPELIIFTQRHLGAALLSRGQSRNDQEEGREILQRALALAQATEIEHEVRWISEALQIGQNAP
jgi:serine/threonine protein kinase/tetratricopeptide (TPR) repeat protein